MEFEKFLYKKKIKDLPEDLLPREKALKLGIDKLSDGELLALTLGSGTKGINVIGLADKIVKKFGYEGLKQATLEDLTKIKGIGTSKALQILAIVELSKRICEGTTSIEINSPEDVYNLVKELKKEKKENFICLYTNSINQLLAKETIAVGSLNVVNIPPRDIFIPALEYNAYGIVLVHNHPNATSTPSKEDIEFTNQVRELALKLGFEVLDHIIVGKDGYFSFRENQIW